MAAIILAPDPLAVARPEFRAADAVINHVGRSNEQ
jgi:hypothetical protein